MPSCLDIAQRAPVFCCMAFVLWGSCSDLWSMCIGYWGQTAHRPFLAVVLFMLGFLLSASCLWSLAATSFRGPGYAELPTPTAGFDRQTEHEAGKHLEDSASAIPLLPHGSSSSSSISSGSFNSDFLRSRSPPVGSVRGTKSRSSSNTSRDGPEDESEDSWQDTDSEENDDDDAPLSALVRNTSREVGHLVEHAAPYVEAAGRLQVPSALSHQPHRGGRGGGSILAKANGLPRFCRKCQAPKPDRAHHCSTCERCVLLQDHHCVFIGACVGHQNRKSFVLFLVYASLLCVYSTLLALATIWDFLGRPGAEMRWNEINWAIVFLVGAVFGVTMICFTVFHVYLVTKNKTTIENMESTGIKLELQPGHRLTWADRQELKWAAQRHHPFDLGFRNNMAAVFGGHGWLGVALPIGRPAGDGRHFEVNRRKLERFREACRRIVEGGGEEEHHQSHGS